MLNTSDTGLFIKNATIRHNTRYDYSSVIYVNTKNKVIIVCSIHGSFSQLPNHHLRGQGCPECGAIQTIISNTKTNTKFVTDALIKHNNWYDYSLVDYKNTHTNVDIICPTHGIFSQKPYAHLNGQGCIVCGITKRNLANTTTTSDFIKKANIIHNHTYDYSLVNYISARSKVNIICSKHGTFLQAPCNHLSGYGCMECGKLVKNSKGGYTPEFFNNHPEQKNVPGILYVMNVTNGSERFLKVGITSRTTKQRNSIYKNMTIVPVCEKHMTIYEAFCIEQLLIIELKPYRFYSHTKFAGYTECFQNVPEVVNRLREIFL